MNSPKKKHLFVNWVDGMKINKNHFIASDFASVQHATNIGRASVSPHTYGLLPLHSDKEEVVNIQLSLDSQNSIIANVSNCIAITSNGTFIEIDKNVQQYLKNESDFTRLRVNFNPEEEEGQKFYVVLGVDSYHKIGVGEANTEENPPRHPYVLPKYSLGIVEEEELYNSALGGSFLTIGKLQVLDGKLELLPDYIPPCISVKSHPDLMYIYSELGVFLTTIEKYSLQIIQKILQKNQANDLAGMVQHICQQTLNYLSTALPTYILESTNQSPFQMMVCQVTLSRVVKNNIDIFKGSGKEELINYLSSWTESTQGDFEKILEDVIHLDYKHFDINESMEQLSQFSKILLVLFKKLDDLDYIGQKSDSNIFVKEEVVAKQEIKQRRSFLLD